MPVSVRAAQEKRTGRRYLVNRMAATTPRMTTTTSGTTHLGMPFGSGDVMTTGRLAERATPASGLNPGASIAGRAAEGVAGLAYTGSCSGGSPGEDET